MYQVRESDKHFLWSLLGAVGIILFWRGIWASIDVFWEISGWEWIATPALSLFLGLAVLTFSGLIFREFDPLGGLEKGVKDILHTIQTHPEKSDFKVIYYDNLKKKDVHIKADDIKSIEKNMLLIHEAGREVFIPIHKVKAIHKKDKVFWRM